MVWGFKSVMETFDSLMWAVFAQLERDTIFERIKDAWCSRLRMVRLLVRPLQDSKSMVMTKNP
jgi:hypothetical protein